MTGLVTVVIPVHGNAPLTRRCLDALYAGGLPEGTEVVVVDDASPDDTRVLLAGYTARYGLRVLTHATATGFGGACDDGITAATSRWVCLLNNDTEVHPGWLSALVADAERNPGTAVVGARLLYPNGTVQHAGVVFGRDRQPHHAYVGFPGDHPAVTGSRDLQAVTFACVLLHRPAVLAVGGFDPGYRNGHEDVDLCLRLRAAGRRVRYCGQAVVTHLESATRGRRTPEAAANGRRYLQRWGAGSGNSGQPGAPVQPDDLEIYAADGLFGVTYDGPAGDGTPLRFSVDPLLAGGSGTTADTLLQTRSAQVAELLAEAVTLGVALARTPSVPAPRSSVTAAGPGLPSASLAADDAVQVALAALHRALADRHPGLEGGEVVGAEHRARIRAVCAAARRRLPGEASVAVVSRGDDRLLDLGVPARHFPGDAAGAWLGHHPADGADAVRLLGGAVAAGVTHLLVPGWERWWLVAYPEIAAALGEFDGDPEVALFAPLTRLAPVADPAGAIR